MTTERVVDDEGRVQVPEAIREALGLESGDPVTVDAVDGEVVIRPGERETGVRELQHRGHASPMRVDASKPDRSAEE